MDDPHAHIFGANPTAPPGAGIFGPPKAKTIQIPNDADTDPFEVIQSWNADPKWAQLEKLYQSETVPEHEVLRRKNSEMLSTLTGEDPEKMYVLHDELAKRFTGKNATPAGFNEKLMMGYESGAVFVEAHRALKPLLDGGRLPNEQEYEQIKGILSRSPDPELYAGNGIVEEIGVAMSEQLPRTLYQFLESLDYSVPAAAAGITAGVFLMGTTKNAPLAYKGSLTTAGHVARLMTTKAFMGGTTYGMSDAGGDLERTSMVLDLLDVQERSGKKLDPNVVIAAATLYKAFATAVETAGVTTGLQQIPGIGKLFDEAGRQLILKGGVKRVLLEGIKKYGVAVGTEGTEEMVQSIGSGLIREAAILHYNRTHDNAANKALDKLAAGLRREERQKKLGIDAVIIEEDPREVFKREMEGINPEVDRIEHEFHRILPEAFQEFRQAALARMGMAAGGTVINTVTDIPAATQMTIDTARKETSEAQASRNRDETALAQAKKSIPERYYTADPLTMELEEVENRKVRQGIIEREQIRIAALPRRQKSDPKIQKRIANLQLFGPEGDPVSLSETRRQHDVISNSSAYESGIRPDGQVIADPYSLAQKYDLSKEQSQKISEKIAAMSGPLALNTFQNHSFLDYQGMYKDIAKRLENPNRIIDVHLLRETFEDYAADRIDQMSARQIVDSYNKELETFFQLKDDFGATHEQHVRFHLETPYHAPPDRRMIHRGLKDYNQKQKKVGEKKLTAKEVQKILSSPRPIINDSVVYDNAKLEEIRGSLKLVEPKLDKPAPLYRQTDRVKRREHNPEFNEEQYRARAKVRAAQRASREFFRGQLQMTQEDRAVRFASEFERLLSDAFRREQGWNWRAEAYANGWTKKLDASLQKMHPEAWEGKTDKHKAQQDELRHRYNLAMQIHLEMRDPQKKQQYLETLTRHRELVTEREGVMLLSHELEAIEDAMRLPSQLKALTEEIAAEYEKVMWEGIEMGVVHAKDFDAIPRFWAEGEKKGKQIIKEYFELKDGQTEIEDISSIIEGWKRGLDLKTSGLIDSFREAAQEIERAGARRRMIDDGLQIHDLTGKTLFSARELPGYRQVMHHQFHTLIELGDMRDIERPPVDAYLRDGRYWRRAPIYAQPEMAKMIENAFGESDLSEKGNALVAFLKWNNIRKKVKLISNLFHTLAYVRSYYFPTQVYSQYFEKDPVKAVKMGLDALHASQGINSEHTQLLSMLIEEGLTVDMKQDFFDLGDQQQTWVGKKLESMGVTAPTYKKVMDAAGFLQHFTFDVCGRGFKTAAAIQEFKQHMAEHPLDDPRQVAARVASVINDDFGGINLRREGRNPSNQLLFRALIMAPDWTESNVRTMVRVFDGRVDEQTRKAYLRFWLRSLIKGISVTQMGNLMIAALAGEDPLEEMKENFQQIIEYGTADWRNTRRNLLHFADLDLTPLWRAMDNTPLDNLFGGNLVELGVGERKYSTVMGHFGDIFKFAFLTGESAMGKKAMGTDDVFTFLFGTIYNGQEFKSLGQFIDDADDFDGIGDFFDTYNYVHWAGGKQKSVALLDGTLPVWAMHRLLNWFPVQADQFLELAHGREDVLSAFMTSVGFGAHSMKPREKKRTR